MPEVVRVARGCADPTCDAPRDARLTISLLVALPLLGLALRHAGFRRTYTALGRGSARRLANRGRRRGRTLGNAPATPRDIAALVVHVNRHVLPYQSRCLLESLALWYLLRRRGHAAELLLGARTLLGPFEAHAWVELDGCALNDTRHVRDIYAPFELPAGAPESAPR